MTTYKEAGVDVAKNEMLVSMIKGMTNISTGFADTQDIGNGQFIALSCDGVGTKIKLLRRHPGLAMMVGQDLVGMCANDLICSGANPTFFLDYIGMNSLDRNTINDIIFSIKNACDKFDMKLVGGEMAEMPDTYVGDYPELVGFAVGFGAENTKIKKESVVPENVVIGLESSGPHSNGFSLINAIGIGAFYDDELRRLVAPTQLYTEVNTFHQVAPNIIKSMAHITGGGLEENLQRAIPEELRIVIDHASWKVPEIFKTIKKIGEVSWDSMWSTFNMGIGMCLIVKQEHADFVMKNVQEYNPKIIGRVYERDSL